ncbi:unnamed protein product [Allacma fusca]|uniref:Maf-like protein n=1 Tax=Allacma fusca TaxID=39272 RepID=A0A8J2JIZ1_9HEXA|nr:unnamed protein product [Allacma fusca]
MALRFGDPGGYCASRPDDTGSPNGSPRRKSILENIGLNVEIIPSNFEENLSPEEYQFFGDYAVETARGKAAEVLERLRIEGSQVPQVVIGADTVVTMNDQLFGKPTDEISAAQMLSQLSGQTHQVFTGVVLLWSDSTEGGSKEAYMDTFYEMTKVKMATLTDEIISAYIKTGEPLDKAGSYGIQGLGGSLVEGIEGDYFNVMGFPLHHFCKRHISSFKRRDSSGSFLCFSYFNRSVDDSSPRTVILEQDSETLVLKLEQFFFWFQSTQSQLLRVGILSGLNFNFPLHCTNHSLQAPILLYS